MMILTNPVGLIVILSIAGAGPPSIDPVAFCSEMSGLYASLPEVVPTPLSESERERIGDARTCMRNFPWPDGEFVDDDGGYGRGMSAERMGEIKANLHNILTSYPETGDVLRGLDQTSDPYTRQVLFDLLKGRDRDLLSRYGTLLHLLTLVGEDLPDEILQIARAEIERSDASPAPSKPDEMAAVTYFTRQGLDNLFIVLEYKALSLQIAGLEAREESQRHLREFLEIRPLLAAEIEIVGDPSRFLFWNAGCEP